jgi:hypothetical protein
MDRKDYAYELEKKKYLTQTEVADYFRVVPGTVKNWRDQGFLTFWQAPGSTRVLYLRESVEDFERHHTKTAKVTEFRKPAEIKREILGMSSKPNKKEWRI